MKQKELKTYRFIMGYGQEVVMELDADLKTRSEIQINGKWYLVYPEGCPCNCWWATKPLDGIQ
jgi:hypothetical protein